jgi:hypothetical protein
VGKRVLKQAASQVESNSVYDAAMKIFIRKMTRRRLILAGYGVSLAIVALCVAILSLFWLFSIQADRLAVVANCLALGTLALALIAGSVALQAYAAATGLPDLEVKLSFPFSHPNQPAFTLPEVKHGAVAALAQNQSLATIYIRNKGVYSAKNPAITIQIKGMAILPRGYSASEGWTPIEYASTLGITAFQWDGGPMYSIHGRSTRRLPFLNMQKLVYGAADAGFTIELLADGYRREISIPVRFMAPGMQLEEADAPEWL